MTMNSSVPSGCEDRYEDPRFMGTLLIVGSCMSFSLIFSGYVFCATAYQAKKMQKLLRAGAALPRGLSVVIVDDETNTGMLNSNSRAQDVPSDSSPCNTLQPNCTIPAFNVQDLSSMYDVLPEYVTEPTQDLRLKVLRRASMFPTIAEGDEEYVKGISLNSTQPKPSSFSGQSSSKKHSKEPQKTSHPLSNRLLVPLRNDYGTLVRISSQEQIDKLSRFIFNNEECEWFGSNRAPPRERNLRKLSVEQIFSKIAPKATPSNISTTNDSNLDIFDEGTASKVATNFYESKNTIGHRIKKVSLSAVQNSFNTLSRALGKEFSDPSSNNKGGQSLEESSSENHPKAEAVEIVKKGPRFKKNVPAVEVVQTAPLVQQLANKKTEQQQVPNHRDGISGRSKSSSDVLKFQPPQYMMRMNSNLSIQSEVQDTIRYKSQRRTGIDFSRAT